MGSFPETLIASESQLPKRSVKIKPGFSFVLDNFYRKAQPALLNAGEMGEFLTCFWQSSYLRWQLEPHNIHCSSISVEK